MKRKSEYRIVETAPDGCCSAQGWCTSEEGGSSPGAGSLRGSRLRGFALRVRACVRLSSRHDWTLAARVVILLCLLCVLPVSARAAIVESEECGASGGNVTWTLDDTGLLTISGTGAMKDWSSAIPSPWSIYSIIRERNRITSIVICEGVTNVGASAFSSCGYLTAVMLPDSIRKIGSDAFANCYSLSEITIPNGVISIGRHALAGCNMTNITIPGSVTSIDITGFARDENLRSVTVADSNPNYCSVDGVLFNKSRTKLISYPGGKGSSYFIPDGTSIIGSEAFTACFGLTNIIIPDSVITIEDGAFSYCQGLTSVTIPGNVTSIGEYAFTYCQSLREVNILSGAVNIGAVAFGSCTGLVSIGIPNSVTSIGVASFTICDLLHDVYYSGTEEQWQVIEMDDYTRQRLSTIAIIHYGETISSGGFSETGGTGLPNTSSLNYRGAYGWISLLSALAATGVYVITLRGKRS